MDGDKVHQGLPGPYQDSYEELCEGHWGTEKLAEGLEKPLKWSLKFYDDGPVQLIIKVWEHHLAPLFDAGPLLGHTIDWAQQRKNLNGLMRQIHAKKRGLELAVQSCQQQVVKLQHGEWPNDPGELLYNLMKGYVWGVFVADFASQVATPQQHVNDADHDEVIARLGSTVPYLDQVASVFATQLVKHRSVCALRLPGHPRDQQTFDIEHTDLLQIGR